MCRHADVTLGGGDKGPWIALDHPLTPQIAQKRPRRGELARRRRSRLTTPMEFGKKCPHRLAIQLRGRQLAELAAPFVSCEAKKLDDVALVGANRMGRCVPVQAQELEKRLEEGGHGRPLPAVRASSMAN